MNFNNYFTKCSYGLTLATLVMASNNVYSQDFLSAIRPSTKSFQQLAVFDVEPGSVPLDKVEGAVLSAIQIYANQARAERKLMPPSLPEIPSTLTFSEIKSPFGVLLQLPVCNDAVVIINSSDTGMAQYGDVTTSMACIFPYNKGYRVNYYAKFSESSGGTVAQVGAAFGKMLTRYGNGR